MGDEGEPESTPDPIPQREKMSKLMIQKIKVYEKLVEAVNGQDRESVLDALVNCAMNDIKLFSFTPTLEEIGLVQTMDDKQQMVFRKNLVKICNERE